jgi:hypothetical protein
VEGNYDRGHTSTSKRHHRHLPGYVELLTQLWVGLRRQYGRIEFHCYRSDYDLALTVYLDFKGFWGSRSVKEIKSQ